MFVRRLLYWQRSDNQKQTIVLNKVKNTYLTKELNKYAINDLCACKLFLKDLLTALMAIE